MENQLLKPKSLQDVKDEYAREKHYNNWLEYRDEEMLTTEEVDTIATRYAAEQVKNLRAAALNYLDCQLNAKDKSVSEIINAGTELRTVLSKT